MTSRSRRILFGGILAALIAVIGWTYQRSLVPAIHPDHDHGLENLAGGGFLWVDKPEGGKRNLVGRPRGVLVMHWFEMGSPESAAELPALVDYARSVENNREIEVIMIAAGSKREAVLAWARGPMDWSAHATHVAIEGYLAGGAGHQH